MVQGFATLAAPLSILLRKKIRFEWSDLYAESFIKLKAALACALVLAHADQSKPFQVETDASDIGIGATLT